jgi:peptide/nickel transport system permease protein
MIKYFIKRFIHALVVLIGVSMVVFLIVHLSGDPALLMLPPEATSEDIQKFRETMGFNDPLWVQYGRFLHRAVRGDFGTSLHHNEPAIAIVFERLPATFELTIASMIIAILLGIPSGIIAAVRRNTLLDTLVRIGALLGQATPIFWMGIMLVLLFSVNMRIFPTSGRGQFIQLVMPAFTLGFYSVAMIARLLRSALLEVLEQDYIRTARAKGLSPHSVILKHALKNSLIPVVTIIGLQTGHLLGGAVITESIFAWPGVGRLAVQSIYARDFPVVQAVVFIVATLFVFINFLVDLSYTWLDPRISLGRGQNK